jgi:hypothetical protein
MLSKNGQRLTDLLDWEKRAGPKRPGQWKEYHSAMECARAWLDSTPNLPSEIVAALRSHPHFGPVTNWAAEPEVRLPLDGRPGETRNTDLLVEVTDTFGPFLVALEAKAGEVFDATIAEVMLDALERKLASPRSGALARVVDLTLTLLGAKKPGQRDVGALRYQLFTGAVGALRAAEDRGVSRAIFLIHDFVAPKFNPVRRLQNQVDLADWLARVSGGEYSALDDNVVVGPIRLPESALLTGTARLYVGKATRELHRAGA